MARGKKFPVGLWAFEPPAPAGTLKSSKIHRHRTVAGKRGRRSETLVKIVKVDTKTLPRTWLYTRPHVVRAR